MESHAWDWISTADVSAQLEIEPKGLAPDFCYLYQKGFVEVDTERVRAEPEGPKLISPFVARDFEVLGPEHL